MTLKCITMRYTLAILGSIGMGIIYGLKVNLHVTIVSMVNYTAIGDQEGHSAGNRSGCYVSQANLIEEQKEDGPFEWSSTIQAQVLSSYFWGYLATQFAGGTMAEKFSAKWVMFFAVATNVACTLVIPIVAPLHYVWLLIMRVLQGIGGGVTFPAMHVMLARWSPPNERSVMSSIVYTGTSLGTVIFMLISGLIAGNIGWEYVFYIEGIFSAFWMIFWVIFVYDFPSQHRYITEEEREFINKELNVTGEGGSHGKKRKMPWKAVLKSVPFWAILVAHTCSNWGWYMVLIELPIYMKTALNFSMNDNAVLTSIPFLTMFVFSLILSKVLDTLRTKGKISTTLARKIATAFASVVPALCFIILTIVPCDRTLAVVLMTVAVTSIGGMFCGFLSNHIDIAPNYAGILMGMTNTIATIPGIVVPLFVGQMLKSDNIITAWNTIFYVTIALYVVEIVVYNIFGTGNEQKWNREPESGETQPLKSP